LSIKDILPSKFFPYLRYKECKEWVEYSSLSHSSQRVVRDYAESLGQFIRFSKKSPSELVKLSYDDVYRLMERFVLWRVRKLKISPKTVHRQWFAIASFFKFHRIKGEYKFPSRSIPVTVKYLDKIPSKKELQQILQAPKLDLPTKISIHLMAYAGMRPEDIAKLTYDCLKKDLEENKIPNAVYVPQEKTENIYLTFIPEETVNLIKQYLDYRINNGEEITDSSPIILNEWEFKRSGKVKHVLRKNISRKIKDAMKNSGIKTVETFGKKIQKMRPYSLRKYFRSNLTGHAPNEYIEAWLGHLSGLEHVYGGTRDLDPNTIERMREAYKNCEPFLLASFQPIEHSMIVKEAKVEALKSIAKTLFGIDLIEVKIAKEKELKRDLDKDEEIQLFENELKKLREKPDPQIIVKEEELANYLAEGWEFVSVLPSKKY